MLFRSLLIKSIGGYASALEHQNVEQYEGEITTMMLASHAIAFFSSLLMAFVTAFPVFGTLMNLTGVLLVDHYIDTVDVYV